MEEWEAVIKRLGSYAYDHLYDTDPWFKQLSEQAVMISDIIHFQLPEHCYAHCLRKIFREIPHPYITVDQLSLVLRSSRVMRNVDKYRLICRQYQKHFTEESACAKPRSLLHLCRCSIRKCLENNENLPSGIYELDIPNMLKDYLDLDTQDIPETLELIYHVSPNVRTLLHNYLDLNS